ncbi:Periodic tryptophan protein 2 homolog [Talaromyces islandicus]|uniref:Periodic tryptophan protein 2 homolog n=1 Tax=Talaromyces islandicus TaxID=28573 RepID=A0A0U1LIS4_TALIS|nr:Periodic tryptophan protein 2 homolog [Talaromyces islandicus]
MPNQMRDLQNSTTHPFRTFTRRTLTYGPYGKDIHYRHFNPDSFNDVPLEYHSAHSAWETPDPGFWTKEGYAIVRADERGTGQSPGILDTMSRGTSEAFFDVIEWASSQPWSPGKVGLLGISYYAGSQWRVAARQPKGLACIILWEGMSDYYRDRCRHGGILSNTFISFWWNRQVVTNQYGRPGRAARNWGPDTIEGDPSEGELLANRQDQTIDNTNHRFRDDSYYSSKEYDMTDINVPILSVANWGGILLHLRGNVEGYMNAGSKFKYLRFITDRHDLPFYEKRNVQLQKSFLDAFLKGDDAAGWTTGNVPHVGLTLRRGNVGYNNAEAERQYEHRFEEEWPISRTQYTKYYLTSSHGLPAQTENITRESTISRERKITGHIVVHLNVSVTALDGSQSTPAEIDLFITLRHLDALGQEIFYTGTVGDPVPVTKGWLRVSLRKTTDNRPRHKPWHPHREYLASDILPVNAGEVYGVDVEVWPTNVVVSPVHRLVLEIHDYPKPYSETAQTRLNMASFDKIILKRLSYVIYEHPDISRFDQFAKDFGFELSWTSPKGDIFYRGYGIDPFCYIARQAPEGQGKKFHGAGFIAKSAQDFQQACELPGAAVAHVTGRPGSGKMVSVTDPNGYIIEVVYGQEDRPIPTKAISNLYDGLPNTNGAIEKKRKDIVGKGDGSSTDLMSFYHLDLGAEYVDHHCLLFAAHGKNGKGTSVHHSSFEVNDLDTQMMGHRWLSEKGYKAKWGVGRHVMGSQIFDYWIDTTGFVIEHYADGDVVNEDIPTVRSVAKPGMKSPLVPDELDISPSDFVFLETLEGKSSVVFKVIVCDQPRVMVSHDRGPSKYDPPNREVNLFVCESTAYRHLKARGFCERRVIPEFYGIEYIPDLHQIDLSNYTKEQITQLRQILDDIHQAGVLHHDTYPRNMCVSESQDRVLWIDFDSAQTFSKERPISERQKMWFKNEVGLVEEIFDSLVMFITTTVNYDFGLTVF